jgi:hypothetical protein
VNAKFLGLAASLVLLGAAPVKATTIYQFDTSVSGTVAVAGEVDVSVSGSTATFMVSLPTGYTFTQLAFDLTGGTVGAGAYTIDPNANANYNKGKLWPNFGPFNTTLSGSFSNTLTFTVSDFAGLFNVTVSGAPIWFVAAGVTNGGTSGIIAADSVATTPLPAALPLFASGLGTLGVLGWRRKKKAQRAA